MIAMMEEFITTVESILKTLECPICLELLTAPVSAGCGHFFCRQCVSGILLSTYRAPCPLCKQSFTRRSVQEAVQRQSVISASKILANTCASLTGVNFITQNPVFKLATESGVNAAIPTKKLKLSNKKTENNSTRKRKSFENEGGGEQLNNESISDLEMRNCSNVADNSSLNKRACPGSEDESDLPALADVIQAFQNTAAPVINEVIAEQCPSIKLSDKTNALKADFPELKAQNMSKPFDSLVVNSKTKVIRFSSSEKNQVDTILNKKPNESEIESNSPLPKSKNNVPLKGKRNALKKKMNKVYSVQSIKQKTLKDIKEAEIESEDKSKGNEPCLSPIGESLLELNRCDKKLNKFKRKNDTKMQNSNKNDTLDLSITENTFSKKSEISLVLDADKRDATHLTKPCAKMIVEDPFKSMGLTDTAVSVGCVASPLTTKMPSVQKSPGWSRVKEVKKDFKVKKFTLLHIEKNSPSISAKNSMLSEHETTSSIAKSDASLDPPSEGRVENKSFGASNVQVHPVRNCKETKKMMDSSSLVSEEVHYKDDSRSSNFSNVDESNLHEVPKELDCSTTTPHEYNNPADSPNTTTLKTNLDLAESRIVINNVPCVNITSNSLICAKYSDTLDKICNQGILRTPKLVCELQNTFLMDKNAVDSPRETIVSEFVRQEKIQKCPLESKHELFTNASEMKHSSFPLPAHISENQRLQSHPVHNDDHFQYVEQSQQTSQVFDFHKSVCDNLKAVVVQQQSPHFYCSNTEKTKVVKRTCLTLEEIQECFLKSSQSNSSEELCSLPFLSGLFKLHIGVSDETLNVSVLRVVDPSYEDNVGQNNVPLSDKCNNLLIPSVIVPSSNTGSEASQAETVDPFPYLNKNSLNQKHFKYSALLESNHIKSKSDVCNLTAFSVPEPNDVIEKHSSCENREILTNVEYVNVSEIANFPGESTDEIQKDPKSFSFFPQDKSSKDGSLNEISMDPEQLLPQSNTATMECYFPTSEENCSNSVAYESGLVTEIVNVGFDDPLNSEEEESFNKFQQCVHKEQPVHERKQSRLSLKKKSALTRIPPQELSDESDLETSVSNKRLPKEVKNQASLSVSPILLSQGDLYSSTINNNTENLSKVAGELPCTLNSMLSEETSQLNETEIRAEIADLSDKIKSLEGKLQACGSIAMLNKTALGSEELNKSVALPDSESEDSVDIFPPTPPAKQI